MKYIVFLLLAWSGLSFAQHEVYQGPIVITQPYPFAASHQYPDIPGFCVVPTWEYPLADQNRDGQTSLEEIKGYCRRVDLQRQRKWVRDIEGLALPH